MSAVTELTKRVEKALQDYQNKKEEWGKEKEELINQVKELEKINSSYNEIKATTEILEDENKILKEQLNELSNQLNSKEKEQEKNAGEIIDFIEKEKGWTIREKQLLDGFEDYKAKVFKTIKYLVEKVIEPLEEAALENPSSIVVEEELKQQIEELTEKKQKKEMPIQTAEVTVKTNNGPAEVKKIFIRPAENELQEMIKDTKKKKS